MSSRQILIGIDIDIDRIEVESASAILCEAGGVHRIIQNTESKSVFLLL